MVGLKAYTQSRDDNVIQGADNVLVLEKDDYMEATHAEDFGKALCYPQASISDVNWLKAALLYWDGIHRIVPFPEYGLRDNPEVTPFAEAGLLDPILPRAYLVDAERRFLDFIQPIVDSNQQEPLLALRQMVDSLDNRPVPVTQLHEMKMTESLRHFLETAHLGQRQGSHLLVNQELGGIYMMCLATEISIKTGAPPITYGQTFRSMGEYLLFGKLRQDLAPDLQQGDLLLKLGIKVPTPESLAEVSSARLIKFHDKHANERRRFRQEIGKYISQALALHDRYELNDYLSQKNIELKEAISDHEKAIKTLSNKRIYSLLEISTPAVFASAVAALAGIPIAGTVIGAAGILVSLHKWWADVREGQQDAQKSPWHYYLAMKQELPA